MQTSRCVEGKGQRLGGESFHKEVTFPTFTVVVHLMTRRPTKVAAVALANKMARMVWAIMTSGEPYREPVPRAA